jgi:hypothetical protein
VKGNGSIPWHPAKRNVLVNSSEGPGVFWSKINAEDLVWSGRRNVGNIRVGGRVSKRIGRVAVARGGGTGLIEDLGALQRGKERGV